MASFKPLPALKRGLRDAAIVIGSPVRGLRPLRCARCATEKLPNPVSITVAPLRNVSDIAPNIASTARWAEAWERSAVRATCSMSSALFTVCPPVGLAGQDVERITARKFGARYSYNKRWFTLQVGGQIAATRGRSRGSRTQNARIRRALHSAIAGPGERRDDLSPQRSKPNVS